MDAAGLPPANPAAAGAAQGKLYGDSTKPEVCDSLDAKPEGGASHKSLPLNEPGLALNIFWLPADREEGVRCAQTQVWARQTGSSPGSDVTRWNQMGD